MLFVLFERRNKRLHIAERRLREDAGVVEVEEMAEEVE
jgi:hypothetical protein